MTSVGLSGLQFHPHDDRILAAIIVSARNTGAKVVLVGASERVQKLLGIVWPLDFVARAATVDEALASLS